jgi:hypothetical protein
VVQTFGWIFLKISVTMTATEGIRKRKDSGKLSLLEVNKAAVEERAWLEAKRTIG